MSAIIFQIKCNTWCIWLKDLLFWARSYRNVDSFAMQMTLFLYILNHLIFAIISTCLLNDAPPKQSSQHYYKPFLKTYIWMLQTITTYPILPVLSVTNSAKCRIPFIMYLLQLPSEVDAGCLQGKNGQTCGGHTGGLHETANWPCYFTVISKG